jgi:hypothetical protein
MIWVGSDVENKSLNSKFQPPDNIQIPSSQAPALIALHLVVWFLEFFWMLGVGIWNFPHWSPRKLLDKKQPNPHNSSTLEHYGTARALIENGGRRCGFIRIGWL